MRTAQRAMVFAACATLAAVFGTEARAQNGSVQPAVCGPGSSPEHGLQGEVPLTDRVDGRSRQGYSCNLQPVGTYPTEGTAYVSPTYASCVYLSSSFPGNLTDVHPGVQVVDSGNPAAPKFTVNLTSPAFVGGLWESLKVNPKRALLAGVSSGAIGIGLGAFDVYSLGSDCSHPVLQNSLTSSGLALPVAVFGHEGGWSPDGLTYWSSGVAFGALSAIDVTNPQKPSIVYSGTLGPTKLTHGFSIRADGNRMYIGTIFPAGVLVLDISDVQSRKPVPQIRQVSAITWNDGFFTQHTIPVSYKNHPYLIAVDEAGSGGIHFIDISNEYNPYVVARIKLGINMPGAAQLRARDLQGNGGFGYEAHYCSVDRPEDPTALACSWFQSGIRVFDIRDMTNIKEIAYYNPPAKVPPPVVDGLRSSEHANGVFGRFPPILTELDAQNLPTAQDAVGAASPNLTADWCSSPPAFRGGQLWVTCQDNGYIALRFTNSAFPLH